MVADERLAARVTVMIDSVEQLEFVEATVGSGGAPVRVCLDPVDELHLVDGDHPVAVVPTYRGEGRAFL